MLLTIKQKLFTSFVVVASITAIYWSLIFTELSAGCIKQLHIDENHILL